jgi:hypothetical protein
LGEGFEYRRKISESLAVLDGVFVRRVQELKFPGVSRKAEVLSCEVHIEFEASFENIGRDCCDQARLDGS